MSQPREGSRVTYIGRPENGPQMGSEGQLLAITGSGGHVRWASGELSYVANVHDDLVAVSSEPVGSRFASTGEELNYTLEFDAARRDSDDDDLLRDSLGGYE